MIETSSPDYLLVYARTELVRMKAGFETRLPIGSALSGPVELAKLNATSPEPLLFLRQSS